MTDQRQEWPWHVRQEDSDGCLIACMAMVCGTSYAAMRARIPEFDNKGLTLFDFMEVLALDGYAAQHIYQWSRLTKKTREPWPLAPWANVHICGVNEGRHGVVLLRDGTVLDPMCDQPRKWSDYPNVGYMTAIFAVSEAPVQSAGGSK